MANAPNLTEDLSLLFYKEFVNPENFHTFFLSRTEEEKNYIAGWVCNVEGETARHIISWGIGLEAEYMRDRVRMNLDPVHPRAIEIFEGLETSVTKAQQKLSEAGSPQQSIAQFFRAADTFDKWHHEVDLRHYRSLLRRNLEAAQSGGPAVEDGDTEHIMPLLTIPLPTGTNAWWAADVRRQVKDAVVFLGGMSDILEQAEISTAIETAARNVLLTSPQPEDVAYGQGVIQYLESTRMIHNSGLAFGRREGSPSSTDTTPRQPAMTRPTRMR